MKKPFLKKESTYWLFGTVAILIIAFFLVRPFIKDISKSSSKKQDVTQREEIKRPPNPFLTKVIKEFEDEIVDLMDRTNSPGAAIAIVKDSTVVYMKGLGVKTAGTKDSIDIHTVFRLASVSKCFASFLTGTLVEDKALHWDDKIVSYVPDFALKSPDQTKQINITHVLSHTTGLPYHTYTNLVEEGLDLKTLLGKLKEVNLSSAPGEEYSYQNVAYSVISEVIHHATGLTYEEKMKENVFAPLHMNDASIDYKTLMANKNVARPHRIAKRKWTPTRINDTYYNVAPAGGVNASISDMSEWMKALLGHREDVIKKETLQHLYSPAVVARSKNRNYAKMEKGSKSYYGLGWRILHYPADTLIYHGGYVTGFRSEVALNPAKDIAICILANAPGELVDTAIPIFFRIFRDHQSEIINWEKKQKSAASAYEN
jgi:beta-lactamase class C